MRSVLISTDLVQKQDGTLTPVEINTNSGHNLGDVPNKSFLENYGDFFDHVEFNNFLVTNNFTKIIVIDKTGGVHRIFERFCEYYNVQYEKIIVDNNAITIPQVEDDTNTLIIRVAYDTYALIDDLYARDMYEFHNLIKNESFASPVTFATGLQDNLDSITNFELSQNGLAPNYVVKPRVPGVGSTEGEYPKLYRFENQTELDSLKTNLGTNEFIQKYEMDFNSLSDERTSHIRSFDLIYGPNLDVQHLITYLIENPVAVTNELLVYDSELNPDKSLNDLFGTKWYPTWYIRNEFQYHFDENDKILMFNGIDKDASDIVVGDDVMSIFFGEGIIEDFNAHPLSVLNNFQLLSANIGGLDEKTKNGIFINITAKDELDNTFQWYDGSSNFYLVEDNSSGEVQWIKGNIGDITVGDKVYVYDKISNSIKHLVIESYYFDIKPVKTYMVSLDDVNQFLMKLGDTVDPQTQQVLTDLYLLQHNACQKYCSISWPYPCAVSRCSTCGKSSQDCPVCTPGGLPVICN